MSKRSEYRLQAGTVMEECPSLAYHIEVMIHYFNKCRYDSLVRQKLAQD